MDGKKIKVEECVFHTNAQIKQAAIMLYKRNWKTLVAAALLSGFVIYATVQLTSFTGIVGIIIISVLSACLGMGYVYIAMGIVIGEQRSVTNLFHFFSSIRWFLKSVLIFMLPTLISIPIKEIYQAAFFFQIDNAIGYNVYQAGLLVILIVVLLFFQLPQYQFVIKPNSSEKEIAGSVVKMWGNIRRYSTFLLSVYGRPTLVLILLYSIIYWGGGYGERHWSYYPSLSVMVAMLLFLLFTLLLFFPYANLCLCIFAYKVLTGKHLGRLFDKALNEPQPTQDCLNQQAQPGTAQAGSKERSLPDARQKEPEKPNDRTPKNPDKSK